MTLSFTGRPPVVAVPAQVPSPVTPNATAIKIVLAERLTTAKQISASDAVLVSEARLIEDELQIHTQLSKTMLPVVLNPKAERVMRETYASIAFRVSASL